jgi:hypothetical protein
LEKCERCPTLSIMDQRCSHHPLLSLLVIIVIRILRHFVADH